MSSQEPVAAPRGRLVVRPVRGWRDRRRFLRLPWSIYARNSAWVPPLLSEVRKLLDEKRNPFFRHSEAQLFLAERDGFPVGRIAAILNRRHLETYDDNTGFFGFFESFDDPETSCALLDRAAAWVAARGLGRLRGPASFTINDECGLLIDAFDLPPVLMMPYNPHYYRPLLEGWGLKKAVDLLAYRIFAPEELPARLRTVEERLLDRHGVTIRQVDLKRFDAEIDRIHAIHCQAWSENWGAVPLTRDEIAHLGKGLRQIADPDLVLLAEDRGEPIGVSVTLPDLNQALHKINGRLFPFGLFTLLWHARKIDAARVLIMGVLKDYRLRGVDAAMYARTIATGIGKGYRWAELSWILESNRPMIRALERLGAERYKTYRMYEREI